MVSVRLPKELEQKIDDLAKTTRMTKSFYVEMALRNFFTQYEKQLLMLAKLNKKGPHVLILDEAGAFFEPDSPYNPLRGLPRYAIGFNKWESIKRHYEIGRISPEYLPERPVFQKLSEKSVQSFGNLKDIEFKPGFDDITEDIFNTLKKLEETWKSDIGRVSYYVWDHIATLWLETPSLSLERLHSMYKDIWDFDYGDSYQKDFDDLRALYPELHMLSDTDLYAFFDHYQKDCNDVGVWTAARENGFLLYLIGILSYPQAHNVMALEIGTWVCYALLHKKPLEEALEFGRAANKYDIALWEMTDTLRKAMTFLSKEERRN